MCFLEFKVLYISSKERMYIKHKSLDEVCSGLEVIKILGNFNICITNYSFQWVIVV